MKSEFQQLNIDKSWTLFLDRDGVINYEKRQDYIHNWSEFKFYRNVPAAFKIFSEIFGKIIIVTNQKGVGKGVTTTEDLDFIHKNMTAEITAAGGRVDAIYYCPDLQNESPNRKPNPGMAHQAKLAFPEIEFSCSVMIGNTISDMKFGRNIGAFTIFLPTTRPEVELNDPSIDAVFNSLHEAALHLENS